MDATVVTQVVASGIATGSIYSLIAISLIIIYNATRTINFAQGELLMISTFVGYTAYTMMGLPLPVALLGAVLGGAVLAFLVERLIIRHAIGATHFDVLIITFGLALVLQSVAGLVWTHDEFPFPSLFAGDPVALGPVRIARDSLGVIGASLALMLALYLLFGFTRLGRAMRAVSQNQRAASLMGISVERIYTAAWVLAAVVSAVAGFLVAPVIFLSSKMGLIVINGFIAAILGGFGSLPGAVIGGMALGVIENLAPLYLPSEIRYSVPFLLLIAILVVRPSGLLGVARQRRV
ncbi:MAG: branched-chain amino acid ABC transporter permease [Candidatus Methylomirabilia bacterium]